jgi:hypothetical protein
MHVGPFLTVLSPLIQHFIMLYIDIKLSVVLLSGLLNLLFVTFENYLFAL